MKTIYSILLSASCLVGGFGIGYIFSKKKFEKKADDEIAMMRNKFNDRLKEIITPEPEAKNKTNKSEKTKTVDIKKEAEAKSHSTYINYTAPYKTTAPSDESSKMPKNNIRVITPEEFMNSSYDSVTLLYYEDGTYVDDDGNIIRNPKDIFGPKINVPKSFGQYEDDSVYVRDDDKKVDYEVLLQKESYWDNSDNDDQYNGY